MNNRTRFFANGIMLTAVGITMRTVSLFFNAFITRKVGAEGLGLYTVVMTVYAFAVTFATAGISLTVTRLVAESYGKGREDRISGILTGGVLYALCFSLVASLVLYFGAGSFAKYVLADERTEICLKILSPSLVPISLIAVFSGYFVGIRRVLCNAATQIFGQLIKVGITIWLVIKLSERGVVYSAIALSLGTTLTEILSFLIIFLEFVFTKTKKKGKKTSEFSKVLKSATPLALSAYVRQALLTVEHILIPKRLRDGGADSISALSSYGMLHGMALPTILYPMATLSSFSGLLVPEYAQRSAQKDELGLKRITSEAFSLTMCYAVATAVFLFLFSEELGYVIYDSYEAGSYIAILAAVVPIMYLDHVTDSVLKGIGEQVYSMWVNITDSILSIILVWILIPKLGIMGYAICIILMEAYNFILSWLRLLKRICFKINIKSAFIFPALSAVLSAFISKKVFVFNGRLTPPSLLFFKIVFAVSMFLVLYKTFAAVQSMGHKAVYNIVKEDQNNKGEQNYGKEICGSTYEGR